MKLMMKFCLCLHKFSELWNLFSLVPMGNCFRCYFRQLLLYLSLRKFNYDCKILKIIRKQELEPWSSIVGSLSRPWYWLVTPRTSRCGDLNKRKTNCKNRWPDVITVQIIKATTNEKLLKDCGIFELRATSQVSISCDVASGERKSYIG